MVGPVLGLILTWLSYSCGSSSFGIIGLTIGNPQIAELNASLQLTIAPDHTNQTYDFWVFEAHTYMVPISLSRVGDRGPRDNGYQVTNHPGMTVFSSDLDPGQQPYVYLTTDSHQDNVTVLLLVRGYSHQYPVPGVSRKKEQNQPGLNLTWDQNMVSLQFQLSENSGSMEYHVYQKYLTERDFDEQNFLKELYDLLLLQDIQNRGTYIETHAAVRHNRILFAAYPGTAAVFAVVVSNKVGLQNGSQVVYSSVYVPAATFACHVDESMPLNCKVLWYNVTKVVCGISVFVGLFVAVIGHRHFSVCQVLFGGMVGYLIGYILLQSYAHLDYFVTLGLSLGLALLFALAWASIWFFWGVPLLATMLPASVLGFLLGCIAVYPVYLNITSDTTFWLIVGCFSVGAALMSLTFTKYVNILSCCIVGTFAIIVPVDHYIGSSLKYILVNVIRRSTVPNFQEAVLRFPFQTNDVALVLAWIALSVMCLVIQCLRERHRAPFPPTPFQQWRWRREVGLSYNRRNYSNSSSLETTPLLSGAEDWSSTEQQFYESPPRYDAPTNTRTPLRRSNDAVVGYIEGYGSVVASSPALRAFQTPEFYEPKLSPNRASNPKGKPREKKTQKSEVAISGRSHQEPDIFKPPNEILSSVASH